MENFEEIQDQIEQNVSEVEEPICVSPNHSHQVKGERWRDLYVYQKSTKPLSLVDTQLEMATDKVSLLIGC